MTRPLRLQFPGALYHVAARGNARQAIYGDDGDRRAWLGILRDVCDRYNTLIHAYCQMTNHYHLLIETPDANLARAMRQLNGLYSQYVNRRHARVGHLFQGRYQAILVQREAYLLELARYIVLNPVRASVVDAPSQWPWSSYHWAFRQGEGPAWLATDALLSHFGPDRAAARAAYREFVTAGIGRASPLAATQYQLILGDPEFIAEYRVAQPASRPEAPRRQRRHAAPVLGDYASRYAQRDEAMARAYWSTAFTMREIGAHFGVSYKTVSRAVQRFQAQRAERPNPGIA